jgi:hypothetical protein
VNRARLALVGIWEFVVGDDWRVALGVAAALALTAIVATSTLASWWLLPACVVALLADSLRRGAR